MTGSVDEFYLGQDIGNDRNVAGRIFLTYDVNGTIGTAGDGDVYVLRTEVGASYTIEPGNLDGIDITFIDENGVETPGARTFTATGTSQFLRITAESGTASYDFRVVKDGMSEISGAGEDILPGELVSDELDAVGDGDSFTMETEAGQRYGAISIGDTGGVRLAISDALSGLGITERERIDAFASRFAFTATSTSTSFSVTAPLANPASTGTYLLLTFEVDVLSNAADDETADIGAWVEAGGGNDTLRATDGLTILDGQDGNDVLDGTDAQGVLIGGAGNDVFIVRGTSDLERDSVVEGEGQGKDEVRSVESIILSSHANVEIARLLGSSAVNVDGSANADAIFGNGAGNILNGLQGADTINGGRGADTVTGGAGRDLMVAGADNLHDVFVFSAVTDTGMGKAADTIRDFRAQDVIDLRPIDADPTRDGDQAFAFGGTKAKANGVWFQIVKGDALVSVDVTGDARADMQILIDGVTRMNAGDFLL